MLTFEAACMKMEKEIGSNYSSSFELYGDLYEALQHSVGDGLATKFNYEASTSTKSTRDVALALVRAFTGNKASAQWVKFHDYCSSRRDNCAVIAHHLPDELADVRRMMDDPSIAFATTTPAPTQPMTLLELNELCGTW